VGIEAIGGWPGVLRPLTQGASLSVEAAGLAMREILEGNASAAQIAAFIVGLRIKGETVDEMLGMVRAMYDAATPLDIAPFTDSAIDIVGAGGAPSRQQAALNVSTMACFVAAGAGAVVCKHGNRKASSTSGAFDFLAAIGIPDDLSPADVARCVREAGVGFAFARTFHPAMRYAAPVRAEIGIPTVFNILGPLANPAHLRRQVIGVSDTIQADKMIRVLEANGAHHVLVVTGDGPLDELALTGESNIHELVDGAIRTYGVTPESVGLDRVGPLAIDGGDAARNASLFAALLDGARGPVRDIVALNAAAGLLVAGIVPDLRAGVEAAHESVDSGAAAAAYQRLLDVLAAIAG
jgi:anthranilate phosphoribosyltransferase